MIKSTLALFCLLLAINVSAQKYLTAGNRSVLKAAEQELITAGDSVFYAKTDEQKVKQATFIGDKLNEVLQLPFSSAYAFDSLKTVRIAHSPDHQLRIFTWFVPFKNGTYRYFGKLQLNTADGKPVIFTLTDSTQNLSNTNQITTASNWLGASYGTILPITAQGKPTYYLLLGWKGNNALSSKKLIEVLSLQKGKPVFGKAIFELPKTKTLANRVVFEYNQQNNMSLYVDKPTNSIIFDHLSPMEPAYKGNFAYYGSDLTFDSYQINYGVLKLKENIELKNEASDIDEFYIPPVKASSLLKNKQ